MDQLELRPISYLAESIHVSQWQARELARHDFFPIGVIVRIGRKVFVNPAKLATFIEAGGKALPGGWKRKPN